MCFTPINLEQCFLLRKLNVKEINIFNRSCAFVKLNFCVCNESLFSSCRRVLQADWSEANDKQSQALCVRFNKSLGAATCRNFPQHNGICSGVMKKESNSGGNLIDCRASGRTAGEVSDSRVRKGARFAYVRYEGTC